MRQIFHSYTLWEDVNNGILEDCYNEEETEVLTLKAKSLLCSMDDFAEVANNVINEWKFSSEQHLSNKARNRQAWIGQAACCYKYRVPEHITKYAWRLMTKKQQDNANYIADLIIKSWEDKNAKGLS